MNQLKFMIVCVLIGGSLVGLGIYESFTDNPEWRMWILVIPGLIIIILPGFYPLFSKDEELHKTKRE